MESTIEFEIPFLKAMWFTFGSGLQMVNLDICIVVVVYVGVVQKGIVEICANQERLTQTDPCRLSPSRLITGAVSTGSKSVARN